MPGNEYLGLIGVLLGWLLTEASHRIWARRDDRRAIAQALTALLEIRHRLMVLPRAVEIVTRGLNVPPESDMALRVALGRLFPVEHGLAKRYSDAVAQVASQDPILGFRLHSQDSVLPRIDQLRELANSDPNAGSTWRRLEPELLTNFNNHLGEHIRQLAWRHGWRTRLQVGRLLNRQIEVPRELIETFSDLAAVVERTPSSVSDQTVDPAGQVQSRSD